MRKSFVELQIPPDKKILKGFALMEIQHQTTHIQDFIMNHWQELNEDSQAVGLALANRYNHRIPVLNYGGLYEGLYVLYHEFLGIEKEFILGKQLASRPRASDKSSKKWIARHVLGSPSASFHLDGYYLELGDKMYRNWPDRKTVTTMMKEPDKNLKRVVDYVNIGKGFHIDNSEIAVSAVILEIADPLETLKLYGEQWKAHETDRTKTLIKALRDYKDGKVIDIPDPRIIFSLIAKSKLDKKDVKIKNEYLVNKIFPQCRNAFAV